MSKLNWFPPTLYFSTGQKRDESGVSYLEKVEPEEHCILQKFYSPVAAFFIVDYDCIPKHAKWYFIQTQMIHLRGIFTASELHHNFSSVSPETLEKLAVAMLKQLEKTCRKHTKEGPVKNAEILQVKIYAEALTARMKQDEWHALFKESKELRL